MAENDNINLEITEAIVEAVSPTATVSKVGDTATITVTDKNGTTTASVKDGDKGDKGDQGDKGDKGDKGDTGNTGATGATPELSIGTVSTLGPGEPATATITGTDEQPVLSLGIPKGAKGDTGNTGAAAGFGTVSASVDANIGTPSVSVTASGSDTAKNFAFAFHNLKGAKGDTGATGNGIASIEETATSGAVHTYTVTYTNGNTTTFDVTDGEVTNASLATILEDYARINGAYESMTVGNAEQLISSVTVNDKVPYNFRTSGGSIDIGNREVDKLVGGTVAWNQLLPTSSGLQKKTIYSGMFPEDNVAIYNGHRYLVSFLQPAGCAVYRQDRTNLTVGYLNYFAPTVATQRQFIATATGTSIGSFASLVSKLETTEELYQLTNCMIIDLTQMFGSTIADYIYSLETATAGAGVAWFKKLFPKDYYAYNAGQLISVKTSAHEMIGFNALVTQPIPHSGTIVFDKTKATRVSANTHYHLTYTGVGNGRIVCRSWDLDSNPIREKNVNAQGWYHNDSGYDLYGGDDNHDDEITFSHDSYIMLYYTTFTSVTDMCLNLSWDGERDGEYEAYKKWTYPLDSDLELRGMPKLDSANNLYYDGDEYKDDGTVTRKYGIVDMSTLSWGYYGGLFNAVIPNFAPPSAYLDRGTGFITSIYPADTQIVIDSTSMTDKTALRLNGGIYIKDTAYTDVTTFKTAMSGVYLVYELATPTTEEADPYQNPQIVDDFGTEEYVDERTVAIPVGHDTEYMNNLKAKLEMAPDSPDGDGDYVVRQTNGENSYVPLMKELPNVPSEDGTYILKCTVSSGTATLGWESEE